MTTADSLTESHDGSQISYGLLIEFIKAIDDISFLHKLQSFGYSGPKLEKIGSFPTDRISPQS